MTKENASDSQINNNKAPDSPKNTLLRLAVGIIIITLGIILFNISSKLYQKAEEKDAKEKAERIEKIREITGEE